MDDNTQVDWSDRPVASLYLDLAATDLGDFVEHFERQVWTAANQLRGTGLYDDDPLLGNVLGYRLLWDEDPPLDNRQFVRVEPVSYGRTRCMVLVSEGDPLQPQVYRIRFILFATRYRRDRLNVVLYERTTQGRAEYADRLRAWLLERWGADGVIERPLEDAPPIPPMPELMPLLPTRATPDQWYAWFDWYYRQAWGAAEVSARLDHMARLTGKSRAQVADMHALYRTGK